MLQEQKPVLSDSGTIPRAHRPHFFFFLNLSILKRADRRLGAQSIYLKMEELQPGIPARTVAAGRMYKTMGDTGSSVLSQVKSSPSCLFGSWYASLVLYCVLSSIQHIFSESPVEIHTDQQSSHMARSGATLSNYGHRVLRENHAQWRPCVLAPALRSLHSWGCNPV
jgi:hypothetical protein